jgi:hypothetical protein
MMIQHLRRVAPLPDGAGLPDRTLVDRFLACRDEAAFEALVRRHGPMVLGVCRRVLRSAEDADDAFQATFLVFVRKAAAIRPRGRVGPWLYGIAYRTALAAPSLPPRAAPFAADPNGRPPGSNNSAAVGMRVAWFLCGA